MPANYTPCSGTGGRTMRAYTFRNESGSAKFARNKGKVYGACHECGKTLVVRSLAEPFAPAHKAQTA